MLRYLRPLLRCRRRLAATRWGRHRLPPRATEVECLLPLRHSAIRHSRSRTRRRMRHPNHHIRSSSSTRPTPILRNLPTTCSRLPFTITTTTTSTICKHSSNCTHHHRPLLRPALRLEVLLEAKIRQRWEEAALRFINHHRIIITVTATVCRIEAGVRATTTTMFLRPSPRRTLPQVPRRTTLIRIPICSSQLRPLSSSSNSNIYRRTPVAICPLLNPQATISWGLHRIIIIFIIITITTMD